MTFLPVIGGAVALVAGATLAIGGIRRGIDVRPVNTAMLIGGMMLAAFGLIVAGFALIYQNADAASAGAGAAQ